MLGLSTLLPLLPLLALLAEPIAADSHGSRPRALAKKHDSVRRAVELNQSKKRSQKLKKKASGANGAQCRVKGQQYQPTTTSAAPASTAAASTTQAAASSAAPSPAASQAPAPAPAAPAPAQQENNNNDNGNNDNSAPAASSAPAPSASSAPADSGNRAANAGVSVGVSVGASSGSAGGSGSANPGSKLGLAWPNGNWAAAGSADYIGNYIGSKSSWYYTWSPWSVGSGDSLGLEFVPMLWGPGHVGDWNAQQGSWPSGVKNALFFNEPNESSQCNMAAGDSVSYWMNNMVPLKSKGISLGGAATTSAPSGLQWVLDFQNACTSAGNSKSDCTPAFIPLHWYDVSVDGFKQYVQNFHQQTGLDIWITEYACQNFNGGAQCSDSDTWNLHQSMASWFDEQDYVKRYAPFGVMEQMQGVNQNNALMNPSGSITSLGSWYIGSA